VISTPWPSASFRSELPSARISNPSRRARICRPLFRRMPAFRGHLAPHDRSRAEGARLAIGRSEPALGSYLEVVVEYDDENTLARAYAIRCDREAPTTWE
jgi:hypothetical protein